MKKNSVCKFGKVYKIVFANDPRVYIGSTKKEYIELRLSKHILDCYSKKTNNKLYNFMRQHAPSNFKIEILQEYENIGAYDLRKEEELYIKKYNAIGQGFNVNKAYISADDLRQKKIQISRQFRLDNPDYFRQYYLQHKKLKIKI